MWHTASTFSICENKIVAYKLLETSEHFELSEFIFALTKISICNRNILRVSFNLLNKRKWFINTIYEESFKKKRLVKRENKEQTGIVACMRTATKKKSKIEAK